MISIIVAVAKNRVIGANNQLIWHIADDLKNFKRITSGHPVIMGRKTFESLGRALPNRRNIVISRNSNYTADGAEVVDSLEQAIKICSPQEENFVIGGGEIYNQAIQIAHKLYITEVDLTPQGDTHFPEIDLKIWKETLREAHEGYTFTEYEKC